MKLFLLCALACLVAIVKAAHPVGVTIEECEENQCDCKQPRVASPVNLIHQDNLGCYCACESQKDQLCEEDLNCKVGLYCAFEKRHGKEGLCEDACKKPGLKCGIFDPCEFNKITEKPECKCKRYRCSDKHIGYGVCAFDELENKLKVFNNDCQFVDLKCERRQNGTMEFQRRPIQDCAGVIPDFGNSPIHFGIGSK